VSQEPWVGHEIVIKPILGVNLPWVLEHRLVLKVGRIGREWCVRSVHRLLVLHLELLLPLLLQLLQLQLLLAQLVLLPPNVRLLDRYVILLGTKAQRGCTQAC